MEVNALVIETGINKEDFQQRVVTDKVNFYYASSFLEVFDVIIEKKISIVFLAEPKEKNIVSEASKMLKTVNQNIEVILLIKYKEITEKIKMYYLQRYIDDIIYIYDSNLIIDKIKRHYMALTSMPEIKPNWSYRTINSLKFLAYNQDRIKSLCNDIYNETEANYTTISTLVKKDTGNSLKVWLNKIRIKNAIYLLTNQEINIKEIADRVGFKSCQGFINAFKRELSTTPNQYKKFHQKNNSSDNFH